MIPALPLLACSQGMLVQLLTEGRGRSCVLADELLGGPKCWTASMSLSLERVSFHETIPACGLQYVTEVVSSLLQSMGKQSKLVGLLVNYKSYSKPFLDCSVFLSLPKWQDRHQHPSAVQGIVKRLVWNMKYLQIEQGPCVTWINRNLNGVETLS